MNARCACDSLERHRLIWLFFNRETDLFDGRSKRMLHVAPEACLGPLMSALPGVEYISGDVEPGRAMVELDVTRIQFPDEHFDVIYCSHVLEHVPDDQQAMREFFRVLKPGGWAVLQVPIRGDKTYEDFSIVDPSERKHHFGQEDHVRWYGAADYVRRLSEAGFRVTPIVYVERLSKRELKRFSLDATERVFYCEKQAGKESRD